MTNINTSFSIGGAPVGATPAAPAPAPAAATPAARPVVFDVTTATFMDEVLDASRDGPIVVDFWAPWCGPCKQLGPVLEKVVNETGGRVRMAKMDIDTSPEVAGQMGIQSIPAVVAFVDGRPAEAFMGAKPESEVRAFIEKLAAAAPVPAGQFDGKAMIDAAKAMFDNGDFGGAAEAYGTVAQHEAGNLDAIAGLGECYMAVGETDMARQLLASVPQEQQAKAPIAPLLKRIELAEQAGDLAPLADLEARVEANPDDHQARLEYAIALNAADHRTDAVDELVKIVKADREWNDDGARAQLLTFFETWGVMDKASIYGRRALSAVIFR